MNSIDIDDSTAIFLTEDQEVGIVVDEEEGEVLRLESEDGRIIFDQMDVLYFINLNEPAPIQEIKDEYDADEDKVEEVINDLHRRGEVYQPTKGYYKVVENAVEN
ncbi:hypothetical protein [Halobacterium salinarum]|uniref:hypothetical protein n=1 Tax=Halobacterium salinarum TaxID=2242 RepID=UPI0025524033|nr:hypothetical protein [Halobacterium salinarum]MDL0144119.1 hypothetical protein [Halobacterium salinarum]